MDALRHAVVVLLLLWPAIARAEDRCPTPLAIPRGEALPTDLSKEARADTLFAKAVAFYADQDFAAAAIVFAQAARAYESLPDQDAHARQCTWAARSNTATAYSRADMPVEALAAFQELDAEHRDELPPEEAKLIDVAIADLARRIGKVELVGLPDGAEVRIDGLAVAPDQARAPIALAEGTHEVEVVARFHRPFLHEFKVLGEDTATVTVKLVESTDPASVRVEANRAPAHVEIDGVPRGNAPFETTLPPGLHEYVVTAPTFREHRATIDVRPGQRTVLHVDLVPARAPWGVRGELYGMMVFGVSAPPFDAPTPAAGALIFHPYLRFRSVWFGFGVELHARSLDNIGAGGMVKVCPESLQFWRGNAQWCPGTFAGYLTSPHEGDAELQSGYAWMRLGTSVEVRTGPFGFVRATPSFDWMGYQTPTDAEAWGYGFGLQLSAGIEL